MTLVDVNRFSQAEFTKELGWIFEDSPWVAERAWHSRPFSSVEQVHGAMKRIVQEATEVEQMKLLRAHPDLGARAHMSAASVGEQGRAGLDRLTPEEYDSLLSMNRDYREKFGFPFLFAVKESSKQEIMEALRRRLTSDGEAERIEALAQVFRIAEFRLEGTIKRGDE